MVHGEVPLDEELIVVGIEDSFVDVLACEGLNGFPGLPEAHRDELGTIALDPPQQPGSAVARRALVAFDSGPLHARFSRSSTATARRYRLKTNPPAAYRGRQGIPAGSLSVDVLICHDEAQ